MSDQDNLRDRIETILDRFTGESWEHHHKNAAQAIINELGLTIEQRDTGLQSNPPGRRIYVSRVVGDWNN